MKRVSITEFEDKLFVKVEHQLKGLVTGVSVFRVEGKQVQEISPGVLNTEDEKKLISRDYDRVATQEEIEAVHEILQKRDEYVLERAVQSMKAIGGATLLRMIELGGRYFAYTMHENLLHTRIAEVLLTPDDLPVDFIEVPVEYLPFLAENIADVLHNEKAQNKGYTILFGEGLFLRLKRSNKALYAIVLQLDSEAGEGKLRAPVAFLLRRKNSKWEYQAEEVVDKVTMNAEVQKALNHVVNELSLAKLKS